MNSKNKTILLVLVAAGVAVLAIGAWRLGPAILHSLETQDSHDEHEGHEEGESHKEDEEGEGHKEDEDGDEHAGEDIDKEGGELSVRLSPEQMRRFGVTLAAAGPGTLHRRIHLPGEIVVNADRSAHVVPPAGGVTRKVNVSVGDSVSAGQAMAVLESAELSGAKTQYLAKLNELSCCSADLTRAEALDASARKLLKAMEKSPTLDQLRAMKLAAMGEGHSKLIAAYAESVFARAEYEREKKLVEQNVSSRADFQTATSAYKKAFAKFVAARDGLAYQTQRSLLEAQRSRRNQEFSVKAAELKLHVLGLDERDMALLSKAVSADAIAATKDKKGCGDSNCTDPNCEECKAEKATAAAKDKKGCDDPNCTDCVAPKATTRPAATKTASRPVLGEQLSVYPLRAPFAGTVIDKHITLGEVLSKDTPVFTVADLSTVWVDLSVYQKDLPHVRKGQTVHIAFGKETPPVEGKITFVSPIVDSGTRTAKARIILANPRGVYRPGLFVTADIDVSATSIPVLVPKAAVQRIEGRNVVFVPSKEGLATQAVRLGQSSRTHVEIVGGLRGGQKYVAKGAFQLKAQIVTGGLGAHAGHGH